jgi:glycosyltransferase involved in cell wall biosynthesis
MNRPLISVITVTWDLLRHGRRETFLSALQCVQKQSFRDIEHIVLDGASTDGTQTFIQELVEDYSSSQDSIPIRFRSDADDGLYDAMNRAVAMARGDYVIFLNSDDTLVGYDLFEKLAKLIRQFPSDFYFGSTLEVRQSGDVKEFARVNLCAFLQRMPFCHNSFLVRRSTFEQLGGHDTNYRVASDYDFVFRMLIAGWSGLDVGFPISSYSSRGVSADRLAVARDYAKVWETFYRQRFPEDVWGKCEHLEWFRVGQLPIRLCVALIKTSDRKSMVRRAALHSLKIAIRRKLQPWRRWDNIGS